MTTNPYQSPTTVAPPPRGPLPHSKLGMASVVVGVLVLLINCGIVLYVFGFGWRTVGPHTYLRDWYDLASLAFWPGVAAALGLGLGLVSLFVRSRTKQFGAWGVALNLVLVLFFAYTYRAGNARIPFSDEAGNTIYVSPAELFKGD